MTMITVEFDGANIGLIQVTIASFRFDFTAGSKKEYEPLIDRLEKMQVNRLTKERERAQKREASNVCHRLARSSTTSASRSSFQR